MAYSDFRSLEELKDKFGIKIVSEDSLFRDVADIKASTQILTILDENVSLALNINTEKARSELIVAPVLLEVRRQLDRKISLFSGIDFSVDQKRNLNGFCDFILSNSSNQVFLQVPVVCIVEAKNENIKSGYVQCIAEMIAAQIYNEQESNNVKYILGVVTTGSNWKFLKLENEKVLIDFDEYLISQLQKILAIFVKGIQDIV